MAAMAAARGLAGMRLFATRLPEAVRQIRWPTSATTDPPPAAGTPSVETTGISDTERLDLKLAAASSVPESLSMLIRHDVPVPAKLLTTSLDWDAVLGGDNLPEEFRARATRERVRLQGYADRGYTIAPQTVESILKEFSVWASLIVPHNVASADAKADGLLTEAMQAFEAGFAGKIQPLDGKINRVLELVRAGNLDAALVLAGRVDEEANRMTKNLDLIRQDIESHLTIRAALTNTLGMCAVGTAALHIGSDLFGLKGDLFGAVRTSGTLLWMALKQWYGGAEYEQLMMHHSRAEVAKMRSITSMQTALDNALFARDYLKTPATAPAAAAAPPLPSLRSLLTSTEPMAVATTTTTTLPPPSVNFRLAEAIGVAPPPDAAAAAESPGVANTTPPMPAGPTPMQQLMEARVELQFCIARDLEDLRAECERKVAELERAVVAGFVDTQPSTADAPPAFQ